MAPGAEERAAGFEAGVDISVADHEEPVAELGRLVEVDRAYRALLRGQRALDRGDDREARAQFALAAGLRHGLEVDFWRAIGLARLGEVDDSLELLDSVIRHQPAFGELLGRLTEHEPVVERLLPKLWNRPAQDPLDS